MPSSTDSRWLAAAASLAARARPLSRPNPAVAAILVKDQSVVGRGWTQQSGRPHAEAVALEQAGYAAQGATLYVTLEPCAHTSSRGPACADLAAASGLARVIVGVEDPDPRTAGQGIARLRDAGIETTLANDPVCAQSLAGYLTRARFSRPHVMLKLAMSLDGCIATADGESQWITGAESRAHVHRQRAFADAILVGGGTWRADRPGLDVRLPGLEDRSPQRVVLTRGVAPDGVKVINAPDQIAQLTEAQYLYVEGGAETAASFIAADLVDALHIYRAPILIGDGRPALGDIGLASLADAQGRWHLTDTRRLGSDTLDVYARSRS